MLSLNSSRWSELQHAYGNADDIPPLLARLTDFPNADGDEEPWFSLWSALVHQGDVYSASFAAVPLVVGALASNPVNASAVYFQFPAWVEICRRKNSTPIPGDLSPAYFSALARLPQLVAEAASRDWNSEFVQCALSAIAAAKGHVALAEAIQELSPDVSSGFMGWLYEREST